MPSGRHSIYGDDKNNCCDIYLNKLIKTTFSTLVNDIQILIKDNFPQFQLQAPVIASVEATAYFPIPIWIRLFLIQQYPDLKYDPTDIMYLVFLKDCYVSNDLQYINDRDIQFGIRIGVIPEDF